MQEIPSIDWVQFVTQPGAYEVGLVGAGAIFVGAVIVCSRFMKPWWEARMVGQQRQHKTDTEVANDLWYYLKCKVKDGELTVEEATTYFHRFANLVPLKELLPDGVKTLKEELLEKHTKPKEETEKIIVTRPSVGMLAQLTARLKTKTA